MAGPLDWLSDPLNISRFGTNDQRIEEARRMQEWINTPRSMNPPVGPNAPAARGEGTPIGFGGERLVGGPNPIARGMGEAAPTSTARPWDGSTVGPRELDARYPASPLVAANILGQGDPNATMQLGAVPLPGFPGSSPPVAQGNATPLGNYMRYRQPTASDPSTWEHAPIPAGMMLRHGSNFDLLPDNAEGRQSNFLDSVRARIQADADANNRYMDAHPELSRRVWDTPLSVNNQFQRMLPALLQQGGRMEEQRLQGIQELGVPGTNILGRVQLQNAAGLGYRDANGNIVPGSVQNAASDALNRTRENERYGPEARYDSFYNQAYNAFPPGTPHQTRVRQLQSQGMAPPQFLTGNQGPRGPGGGNPLAGVGRGEVPRPQQTSMNDAQAAIDAAFESGLSSFPRNPQTGQRMPIEGATAGDAITNILAAIPNDEHLRANFPAIQSRLTEEVPGGQQALNAWLNQTYFTNPITGNPLSSDVQRQQTIRQIQRLNRISGNRPSPNMGILGYTPLGAGGAAGMNWLRDVRGTR